MQDDVVNAPEAHRAGIVGKLFNAPTAAGTAGADVYKGCRPTYTGAVVDKYLLMDVLAGTNRSGHVHTTLGSGPDSKLFLYYVDHGGPGTLTMPNGDDMTAAELAGALNASRKYGELVVYVEACFSGSMFEGPGALPPGARVVAATAANDAEESKATFCPPHDVVDESPIGACLGDAFSVNWLQHPAGGGTTINEQISALKTETVTSHVQQFGDKGGIGREPVASFEGNASTAHAAATAQQLVGESSVAVSDVQAVQLFYRYLRQPSEPGAAERLIAEIQRRETRRKAFETARRAEWGGERPS